MTSPYVKCRSDPVAKEFAGDTVCTSPPPQAVGVTAWHGLLGWRETPDCERGHHPPGFRPEVEDLVWYYSSQQEEHHGPETTEPEQDWPA